MIDLPELAEDESAAHHDRAVLAKVGESVYFGRELLRIGRINAVSFGGPYFLLKKAGLNPWLVCYSVVRFPAEVGIDDQIYKRGR